MTSLYGHKELRAFLPNDITTIIGRFAFEPSRTAKIIKGADHLSLFDSMLHIVRPSKFVFSHKNVQMQIMFCPRCGDYHPGYMHQVWYSNRVLCTCDDDGAPPPGVVPL